MGTTGRNIAKELRPNREHEDIKLSMKLIEKLLNEVAFSYRELDKKLDRIEGILSAHSTQHGTIAGLLDRIDENLSIHAGDMVLQSDRIENLIDELVARIDVRREELEEMKE